MLERKYRYDGSVVDYECTLLERTADHVVLFYAIAKSFAIPYGDANEELMLTDENYTVAYYWREKPYNVYLWRDRTGVFIGAYFNLVRNTVITETQVSFEDLIVDVLLLPDGSYHILDEKELPLPLDQFEKGQVLQDLRRLTGSLGVLFPELLLDAESFMNHDAIAAFHAQKGKGKQGADRWTE